MQKFQVNPPTVVLMDPVSVDGCGETSVRIEGHLKGAADDNETFAGTARKLGNANTEEDKPGKINNLSGRIDFF